MDVGSLIGLNCQGTIRKYDPTTGRVRVGISLSKSDSLSGQEYDMPIPASWMGPNGEFSGGFPAIGATVWCALSQGRQWSIVGFSNSNNVFGNKNTTGSTSLQQNLMSALRPGRWLTQVSNNIRLFIDPNIGIQAGDPNQYIQLDPRKEIYSNTFSEQLAFSDAHRKITGEVKRDLDSNSNRNVTGSALTSHTYALQVIGLDPKTKTGSGLYSVRNPPFNESRELVYEFADSFGFTDDKTEITIYDDQNKVPPLTSYFNRRDSRADTLSLSLVAPNQLMETVKGTVIDAFGNLLDINRAVLPSGQVDSLSFLTTDANKSDTFTALREQSRKTIAYHFELNARKDTLPDDTSINTPTDYARDRSRLSIDVDKEGQFKINVPSSSEVGNISLLTRYENYSTLKAATSSGDISPNQLQRNTSNQDIFHEGFGVGAITLSVGPNAIQGFGAPVDRIKDEPIKLGTAYHNLQDTLQLQNRVNPIFWYDDSIFNKQSSTPLVGNIVTPTVITSGDGANAGGRSGTISLDGHISLSIGANTVDRQSLWMDLAGGIVSSVGRDLQGRSLQSRYDGSIFIQCGSETIDNDSRFGSVDNSVRPGLVDIRIVSSQNNQPGTMGSMTIIRIDSEGIKIATPGSMDIVSHGLMRFKSVGNDIIFDAETIYMYGNMPGGGRAVLRKQQTI
jgi:hypothetical protein